MQFISIIFCIFAAERLRKATGRRPKVGNDCSRSAARHPERVTLATEETQELMQASLLSLRSALPLGLSKNRSFGPRNFA